MQYYTLLHGAEVNFKKVYTNKHSLEYYVVFCSSLHNNQ